MMLARVQAEPIDVGRETDALAASCAEAGAIASFLGIVRSTPAHPIVALSLEHYAGMTEAAIRSICTTATQRFGLLGCVVIHRVGRLLPGESIVLVLAAAHHRKAALDGTAYLIDWLKTSAPFWKKEHFADGQEIWVEARVEDEAATRRWAMRG